jgi:hypothetical protein
MSEVIGWWEDEPIYGELPPPLDPTPFSREGRAMERVDHELRLTEAVINVERLKARKREIQAELRARQARRVLPSDAR